ncbi:DUF4138 domain-containing protein [Mucilaginibacter sp. cycad4]|uniref:DUF4138 domain-containing protein n=1 Tax=Mucilaginibacter sp. cycad4 TaxID=3342096 RepID=UPI002AAAFF40|nr:DUF4138 domain-containing protein [Mucilaginibacter gossypii]WPU99107.1 DUF4138 domain-containing protein [Mucilaginibacter gossypii]
MKKIIFFIALCLSPKLYAQDSLRVIYLPENLNIHFISPEPIQYVDISSKNIIGDLPLKNVLRIRLRDSLKVFDNAVVTIAGEKFIAQYRLLPGHKGAVTEVNIEPADTRPLDIAGVGFSQNQLKAMALRLVAKRPGHRIEKVKAFGLKGKLNYVYTIGDYLFLDISYHNKTNLRYRIADIRFKVDDKKVIKAANSQSVELRPEFVLFPVPSFEKNYRNVFVLRKLSFPGNKVLHVELSEQQLSGRVIILYITYQDILNADTLPD